MSFYATFPSNASMDIYPENTQSNFCILLPKSFPNDLQNRYQVGLAEISYTQAMLVEYGTIEFNLGNTPFLRDYGKKFSQKLELLLDDCLNIESILAWLNEQIETLFETFHYLNFKAVDASSKITDENLEPNKSKYLPILTFVNNSSFKLKIPSECEITFSGIIAEVLFSVKNKTFQTSAREITKEIKHVNDAVIHICDNYLLYVDCIEDQYYGANKHKIIRNIIPEGNHGDKVSIIYNHVHYVDLSKSNISSINFSLCDSQANLIKFSSELSKVIVKLHFKLKNE